MKQLLLDLVAPPVIAGMWWLFSRDWAAGVQAGQVSDQTKNRQKVGFVILLTLAYLAMFGTTAYIHFTK
jgi:hypothetical protein